MKRTKANPHRGFLHDDGTPLTVTAAAKKRMISVAAWGRKQMKDPVFKAEYDRLEPEFATYRENILRDQEKKRVSTPTKPRPSKATPVKSTPNRKKR